MIASVRRSAGYQRTKPHIYKSEWLGNTWFTVLKYRRHAGHTVSESFNNYRRNEP